MAPQPRIANTDWNGCCQMAKMWLAKRVSLNINFNFLNRISLLLISSSYPIVSRCWVDPVPDHILPEKFLGYSRESNPGPLGWQSDKLTTIPNRWSQLDFMYKDFHKEELHITAAVQWGANMGKVMPNHARAGTSTAVARCVANSFNETSQCPPKLCTSEKNLFEAFWTSRFKVLTNSFCCSSYIPPCLQTL